jgi:membrane associated rhomboid family serine protease
LSVVCSSCGEEVSPYVTECPYCGTRIRKRAPKLELRGDELAPRESRRARRRRERAQRAERLGERPYAVLAAIAIPALVVLVQTASATLTVHDLGAIVGHVSASDAWRYFAAPFIYPDTPYLFVVSVGIAIFGVPVERRLGTAATAVLIVACGALGMLAANGVENAVGHNGVLLAAGGNGIALGLLSAWAVLKAGEVRAFPDQDVDVIGAAVAAVVLIMLPLVEDYANVFAGVAGALVGAGCGLAAAYARRQKRPG